MIIVMIHFAAVAESTLMMRYRSDSLHIMELQDRLQIITASCEHSF